MYSNCRPATRPECAPPCLKQFLTRQGGDRIERNFAHKFGTGGLDRHYLAGMENVHKKFLSLRTFRRTAPTSPTDFGCLFSRQISLNHPTP